jgi:hypothetical protein
LTIASTPDPRAVLIGLVVFVALVFGVPFLATVIASIGPQSSFEGYVSPFFTYRVLLVLAAGMFTGLVARRSPIGTAAIVGLLGQLGLVLLAAIGGYWPFDGEALSQLFFKLLYSVTFCVLGGAIGSFFWRRKAGL